MENFNSELPLYLGLQGRENTEELEGGTHAPVQQSIQENEQLLLKNHVKKLREHLLKNAKKLREHLLKNLAKKLREHPLTPPLFV